MTGRILLAITVLLISASLAFSQEKKEKKPQLEWLKGNKPSVELTYGVSQVRLNTSPVSLSNTGMFELRLGFTRQYEAKSYGKDIVNYSNNFLFLSNASVDFTGKPEDSLSVDNSLWRFGFGNKEGYGIKAGGNFVITPYNAGSFAWSEFKYDNNPGIADSLYGTLNDFNDAFRFGSTWEAGINFQIVKGFSITPMYEISHVYPRHLFGKQAMSSLIEFSGLVLIDAFTKKILKNAPVAGVLMNFVLKNAYEFGFYQLRKDQMNWPFTSTAPLRYNTFKVGMNFVF